MIALSELFSLERIHCKCDVKSKKKALQTVAELLGQNLDDEELSEMDFLDALIAREKMGSTGLGHGVSIPHGRIKGLELPLASLITLSEGIDYEAPDDEKVDIVMGLVVPEHCNDEHLQILASLAELFSSEKLRQSLRSCSDADELLEVLTQHDTVIASKEADCAPEPAKVKAGKNAL
ncbi:MAG: PTS sugar transporter subunit IIA [Granulosicoccus sp.]|nr:PTS sugar transporter subunit IIA [Granulosicoccus sp.]